MKTTDGGSDLIVGIRADVFHKEVDEPGVPLQDVKDLQSAIADIDFRWCDHGNRFRLAIAEFQSNVFGQYAGKENGKKAPECGGNARQ
jgi:hypothetical protein